MRLVRWHICRATSKIDVDPTSVLFGGVLQPELPTDLLDTGLEFLDAVHGMVPFPNNTSTSSVLTTRGNIKKCVYAHMQMSLSMALRIFNPLLKDILRFLRKLTMQINGVRRHSAIRIIFPEDQIRCLFVVLCHLAPMRLALLRELLG